MVLIIEKPPAEVAGVLRERGFLAGRLTLEEFTAAVRVIDDIGVTVRPATADRLERAARKVLGMYDALFVTSPESSTRRS
jgi:hypothetical protein